MRVCGFKDAIKSGGSVFWNVGVPPGRWESHSPLPS
jgi:hypothetical protein